MQVIRDRTPSLIIKSIMYAPHACFTPVSHRIRRPMMHRPLCIQESNNINIFLVNLIALQLLEKFQTRLAFLDELLRIDINIE